MTALCVGLAWLVHDVREQEAVLKMIEELNGIVVFDEPSFFGCWSTVRALFGEHAFAPITYVEVCQRTVKVGQRTTDAHLLPLKKLKKLHTLQLINTQVTDLLPLAGLSGLTTLDLRGTKVNNVSPPNEPIDTKSVEARIVKVK